MLSGSRTRARSSMRPPHAGHSCTFTPKVRRSNSAHLMYRHLRPVLCGFGGLLDAAAAQSAAVQVRIESHVSGISLNHRQKSAVGRPVSWCQPLPVPAEQRVLEHTRHKAHQPGLVRHLSPHWIRQRQHPLP